MQRIINLIKSLTRTSTKTAGQWEHKYFGCWVSVFGQSRKSEVFYPYGIKANPPLGTRNVSHLMNGNANNPLSMPMMPGGGNIPNANPGDVILGNPESGNYILLTAAGGLKIVGDIEVQGKMTVSDEVTASDCMTSDGVSLKDHTHSGNPPGSYVAGDTPVTGISGKPVTIP